MPTDLNTPILEGGLRRIPFFNGRTLTAEDLNTEQAANAFERRRLGRALGPGVIEGLFVRSGSEATTLTVEPGLGLAPSGRVIELPSTTEVSVVSEIDQEETAGTEGRFANCSTQHAIVTSGTGAYLIVAEPAAGTSGRVPRVGLEGDGIAGECGAKHRLEGARLRLVCLSVDDETHLPASVRDTINERAQRIETARENGEEPAPADVSILRNLWAHLCLGTPSTLRATASLYDSLCSQAQGEDSSSTDPVRVLRSRGKLSDEVVPLGLLFWAHDRILFVDAWAVRRNVHTLNSRDPIPTPSWSRARGEAALHQFQAHVDDLSKIEPSGDLIDVELCNYFRYLPALCLVPRINSSGSPGVVRETFLGEYPAREPVYVEGHQVPRLLSVSIITQPVDLTNRTALRVYEVRETGMAREAPEPTSTSVSGSVTPYLMLVSGYLPRIGDPRYDLSYWNYAHFSHPADDE